MKRWDTPVILLVVIVLLFAVAIKTFQHFEKQSIGPAPITQMGKIIATPTPKVVIVRTFDLVVKNNKLVSGPTTLSVNQGDHFQITITADVDGELHLHGYNIPVEFKKNKPATLSAAANISGRFPYELEDTKTEIGALEVQPK